MKMRLLRGERIEQAVKEDATYNQLRQNIQVGFPETKKRQHATGEVNVGNVQYVPTVGGLQVNAATRSNTHNYAQTVLFSNVKYQPDGGEGAKFMGSDGKEHTIEPIPLAGSRVKVRCTCLDFHYRFANHNYTDSALMGQRPPLHQRVPGSNRPPVNPMKVSGVCKHILRLVQELTRSGLVK